MAAHQDAFASSKPHIPPRHSSCDSSHSQAIVKADQQSSSTSFLDSAYITWPAPKCRYLPSKASSHDSVKEAFPDFPNPANNLIIARTLLLDKLCRRNASSKRRDAPGNPFRSLYSRVAPYSGHIKEHEDLTRHRASVEHILVAGQALRDQRGHGNAARLVSLRGTYPDMYRNQKEPNPEQILKVKLRLKVKEGIATALAIERDLGFDLSTGQVGAAEAGRERGRSIQRNARRTTRTAIPTKQDHERAVQSLLMLRETYPRYYKAAAVADAINVGVRGESSARDRKGRVEPKTLHPAWSPPQDDNRGAWPASSDDKVDPPARLVLQKSLRSTASASSLKSVKQTTASLLRHVVSKAWVRRPSTPIPVDVAMDVEIDVEEQANLDRAGQKMAGEYVADLDSFPVAVTIRQTEAEMVTEQATASPTKETTTEPQGRDALKRHGQCFVIEREPVLAADHEAEIGNDGEVYVSAPSSPQKQTNASLSTATPVIKRGRSQAESAAATSLSLDGPDADTSGSQSTLIENLKEAMSAEMVSYSKPSSPPRVVYIPASKKLIKRAEPASTTIPDSTKADASSVDEDWVVVSRVPDQQTLQHRHAFRGYMTRPHPLGRPQSRMALSQRYLQQSNDASGNGKMSTHAGDGRRVDVESHLFSDMMHSLNREIFGRPPL